MHKSALKRIGLRLIGPAFAAAMLGTGLSAAAEPVRSGALEIETAWSRASLPGAKAGVAYVTIRNTGEEADRLVGAATPAAMHAELHTHIIEDGIARMREVEDGIPLPAGETVMLKPQGLHVMLMGLKAPLAEGGAFDLTLTFETAPSVTIAVAVGGPGSMGHHMNH